jgi:hypothetical protein
MLVLRDFALAGFQILPEVQLFLVVFDADKYMVQEEPGDYIKGNDR